MDLAVGGARDDLGQECGSMLLDTQVVDLVLRRQERDGAAEIDWKVATDGRDRR